MHIPSSRAAIVGLAALTVAASALAQKTTEQCVKEAQAKGIAPAMLADYLRTCQMPSARSPMDCIKEAQAAGLKGFEVQEHVKACSSGTAPRLAAKPKEAEAAAASSGAGAPAASTVDPQVVKALMEALDTEGIYRPIDPPTGGKFKGLFFASDYQEAYNGFLKWPRVAITFVTSGKDLHCWTIDARIWTNETTSSKERFEICDAQVMVKDDFGKPGVIDPVFEGNIAHGMKNIEMTKRMLARTTDTVRTDGPLPPYRPWFLREFEAEQFGNALKHTFTSQFNKIIFRLAWASGMARKEDAGYSVGSKARLKNDWRMWWVKFEDGGPTQGAR